MHGFLKVDKSLNEVMITSIVESALTFKVNKFIVGAELSLHFIPYAVKVSSNSYKMFIRLA